MRRSLTVLAVLLVVLAGCTGPSGDATTTAPDPTETTDAVETTAEPTGETTAETTTEATTTTTTTTTDAGDGTDDGDGTDSGDGTDGSEDGETTEMATDIPDPETDRLGWEAGVWYNETIPVNNSDGMNATELELTTARAMARVERVRQLEFPGNETIPTEIITREEYRERNLGNTDYSRAYRTFDNTKFEALFFVGEDEDSISVQESNRGSTVAGYYTPTNESIVLVSDSGQPQIDGEETLAQEVAHALQDQRFNISDIQQGDGTRDGYAGALGIIEGDGNLIDSRYAERCAGDWQCVPSPGSDSQADLPENFNWGIYLMEFLPYSDGPPFIEYYFERGGWERINEIYQNPPASSEQVILPEKYDSDPPVDVDLTDRTSGDWERVRPEPPRAGGVRPDHARLGMGSLSSMFMRTAYNDYNVSRVASPSEFLNSDSEEDPLDYALDYTTGWEGDRLHVYHNDRTNETGYVWRLVWESPQDAQEFATQYERLLQYWDGQRVGDDRWEIPEQSPFTDALSVTVDGDTVTVVNAPTAEDLGDVYEPAG